MIAIIIAARKRVIGEIVIVSWVTCQGRSKTRPVWRSKSRPVDSYEIVMGLRGRRAASATLQRPFYPVARSGVGSSAMRVGFVCDGSA